MFFAEAVPAWKSRAVLYALLEEAQLVGVDIVSSYDRMFPNQDKLSGKGLGNLIALPFQGQRAKEGASVFINPESGEPYADQFGFIEEVTRVKPSKLDEIIREWKLEPVRTSPAAKTSTRKSPAETKPGHGPGDEELPDGRHEPNRRHEEPHTPAAEKTHGPHRCEHEEPDKTVGNEGGKNKVDTYNGIDRLVSKCKFVLWCRDNPDAVTEPLWFSLATICVPFKNGREKFHELSKPYKGYGEAATNAKFDNAVNSVVEGVAPHTCETIRKNGFTGCPDDSCDGVKNPVGIAFKDRCAYFTKDGGYFYWKTPRKGPKYQYKLCNFIIKLERDITLDDGYEKRRFFEGAIFCNKKKFDFKIDSKAFFSDGRLREEIGFCAGLSVVYLPEDIKHIRLAAQALSKPKNETVLAQFGWVDKDTFVSPSFVVSIDGIRPNNEIHVDLSDMENARYLDLCMLDNKQFKKTAEHILCDLCELSDHSVTYAMIGHTFFAPIMPFLKDTTRYVLWLRGVTGSSKSFIAKAFQCFFGNFPDGGIVSWTSTMNFIQMVGFHFKDALYLVDDFKKGSIKETSFLIQKLQSYADGTARGRLTSESTTKQTRPIRGLMVSTGEDVPEYEASILARSLIIDVQNKYKNIEAGAKCLQYKPFYSGVMARFLYWFIKNRNQLKINDLVEAYIKTFYQGIEGKQNDIRTARNLALNYLGFTLFCTFLQESRIIGQSEVQLMCSEALKNLKKARDRQLGVVQQEQASNVFLDTLTSLLATGRVTVHEEGSFRYSVTTGEQKEIGPEKIQNMVGFIRQENSPYVYINPIIAYSEVQKIIAQGGGNLKFSRSAIAQQLIADGIMAPGKNGRDTHVIWYYAKCHRVWAIKKSALGFEELAAVKTNIT